jgi:TIR domain
MAKVFISFIHEEQIVAKAVERLIRQKLSSHEVFLSSEWQIYAGEDWLQKITAELRSAEVIVILLSPRSVERPWVNFEAGGAWLAGKPVLPVCHAGMTPDRLPKPYSSLQALTIPKDAYYLIRSVAHHFSGGKPTIPRMPFPPDDPEEAEFVATVEQFNASMI